MPEIYLTVNVDFENFGRIREIKQAMDCPGIEIITVEGNFNGKREYRQIGPQMAREIGKLCRDYHMSDIQFHYPATLYLNGFFEEHFRRSLEFCTLLKEESGAATLTFNYHNNLMPGQNARGYYLLQLQEETLMAAGIIHQLRSPVELIVENNGVLNSANHDTPRYFDIIPEDFVPRKGLEGCCIDTGHAGKVILGFKRKVLPPNLKACYEQYGKLPESARSMQAFIEAAGNIRWLHLADIRRSERHEARFPGDGILDWPLIFHTLYQGIRHDVMATIEIDGGHKPDVFKRILKEAFPYLKERMRG